MAPKNKGGNKAKAAEPKQQPTPKRAPTPEPKTRREEAWANYYATNPWQRAYEEHKLHGMSETDRRNICNQWFLQRPDRPYERLSKKAAKEFWKQVNEANVPWRSLPRPRDAPGEWGYDKNGRDLGDYSIDEYDAYRRKEKKLDLLHWESNRYKNERRRRVEAEKWEKQILVGAHPGDDDDDDDDGSSVPTEEEVEAERERRREMAALKKELYGEKMDSYAMDPEWDDIEPIPQVEPEGALAAIAYPDDYVESMSYLRAVMTKKEYSPRCLKLTEHVISMNPAHYTVWLYRFSIIEALNISIPDEIAWLNDVSLTHLKNYQIWHHRQLLIDHLYPSIVTDPARVAALADSEREFLVRMLEQDTKNYHVWSYRQYLVRKLGMWGDVERRSVEDMVDEDVRNNSAWSHRFFLVFSDPAHTTPDSHATEHDPKVPADVIDREVAYATSKIGLAPQNQSPWNYLRGVLVKGGRNLGSVRAFAEGFVKDLGEGEENEEVRSSHALDLLAEIYNEAGEKDRADLCLRRLGEKWDRIRKGYWEYRRRTLG